jgi:hypothetical protein
MNPLEIKKPCGENWDNMRLGLISRHCGKCDKDVVDFTQMSKPEIFQYLYDNRDKKTCARIYSWQVDYTYEDIELTIKKLRPAQRKSNYYFYLLALGAFALGSCNYENKTVDNRVVENINAGQIRPSADTAIKKIDSTVKQVEIGEIKPKHIEPIPDPGYLIKGEMPMPFEPELTETVLNPDDMVYNIVEQMPEFYGGSETLKLYVQSRLKSIENENNLSGKIIVNFVVDENGVVSNPKIIKTVQGLQNYEKAVIRIFNEMPKWKAGVQSGRTVKVNMNFQIHIEGDRA